MKIIIDVLEMDERMYCSGKIDRVLSFSPLFIDPFFYDKYYGQDVLEICVDIIMIEKHVNMEQFFNPRKPQYTKWFYSHEIPSNSPEIWNRRFTIETRLSNEAYNALLAANSDKADAIIAKEFYRALEQLDKLPKRLKDFDKEGFKRDVEALFRSHGWL